MPAEPGLEDYMLRGNISCQGPPRLTRHSQTESRNDRPPSVPKGCPPPGSPVDYKTPRNRIPKPLTRLSSTAKENWRTVHDNEMKHLVGYKRYCRTTWKVLNIPPHLATCIDICALRKAGNYLLNVGPDKAQTGRPGHGPPPREGAGG